MCRTSLPTKHQAATTVARTLAAGLLGVLAGVSGLELASHEAGTPAASQQWSSAPAKPVHP